MVLGLGSQVLGLAPNTQNRRPTGATMQCEWVRENIVLQVYGELADDARHELEQHVSRCADCAAELKAEQDFRPLLAQDRAADPTPHLVAASRMRLPQGLETVKQRSF